MIFIAGNSNKKLAQGIAEELAIQLTEAKTKRFEDQELKVQISINLHKQNVAILQSTSKPANDHLMELLLLIDTAKRAGSEKITAIIPYFGYSRQDRSSYTYGPVSAGLVVKLIESAGVDKVITIDLHSQRLIEFFKIEIQNFNPFSIFLPMFYSGSNYTVISPDQGGLIRARVFADKLGAELAIINKSRQPNGECIGTEIIGNVTGKDCIIIDDIVDTGSTLFTACNLLKMHGAKSINACITHGVFSGDCLQKIGQVGFNKFYITDTINHIFLPNYINVITVRDLIVKALTS